jgi:Cdc25 family phosphatase
MLDVSKQVDSLIKPFLPFKLKEWITSSSNPDRDFVIIDVRDRDYKYAHIPGSVHYPSRSFNATAIKSLLDKYPTEQYSYIFHCMRSEIRGPSCARRFVIYLLNEADSRTLPDVYILNGGFKRWFELYGEVDGLMEPI